MFYNYTIIFSYSECNKKYCYILLTSSEKFYYSDTISQYKSTGYILYVHAVIYIWQNSISADLCNHMSFDYSKFIIEMGKPSSLINLLCSADI